MKITSIKGVFFSGTGNTAKIVATLATKLSDLFEVENQLLCINHPAARKSIIPCSETELVIVATPVYDGRVPEFLLPYLNSNLVGNNTLVIPVCCYGNRGVDDALVELRNILETRGFRSVGAAAVVGQHVFTHNLGTSRPGVKDKRVIEDLAVQLKKKIDDLDAIPEYPIDVVGNDPVGPYNTPRDRYGYPINISKVRPKTSKDHLDTAKNMIKLCPVGAIAPDGVQIPGPCMRCGVCIKLSPRGARYYDDEAMSFYKKELDAQYQKPQESQIFY